MNKIKVLFLAANPYSTQPLKPDRDLGPAANPAGTQPLRLDEEIRLITAKVRAAEYRDSLELIARWAVRPDDLMQSLLEVKPHIVHFSGHGSAAREIILLDDQGNPKPVSQEALVNLFRALKDNVRVNMLNACYTRAQAEALAQTIDCTIGMSQPIGDEAARVFAASFYRAIGFGRSVKEAFELGKAALMLEGIPEDKTPELLTRPGVDAAEIVLLAEPVAATPSAKESAVKGTGKQPGGVDRRALVRLLTGLDHADFAALVTAIPGAASHISRHGTITELAGELIRWARVPPVRGSWPSRRLTRNCKTLNRPIAAGKVSQEQRNFRAT
jgi:hypothetical protein